ncbi:enoyl-CoA hydratase/isomerase family protein [Rhodovibrionaceae bacterium A322]
MADTILVARDGAVVTVTLNRPDKLNAMTKPMWQLLGDHLIDLSADENLRCLVLRGAGGRAFSPGNDIGEFETDRSNAAQAKAYGKLMHRTLGALQSCPFPTLALIEGICVGGGLEMAACCDLRIAGQSSRFGVPIKNLGLVMAHQELAPLIKLVGRARAMEILLEGRIFGAEEAFQKGLLTRIVPDEQVVEEAYATAGRIADGAPLVARWHKAFAARLEDPTPLSEAELDEGFACYDSKDFQIGYRAFLAKTKPEFEGQ